MGTLRSWLLDKLADLLLALVVTWLFSRGKRRRFKRTFVPIVATLLARDAVARLLVAVQGYAVATKVNIRALDEDTPAPGAE
jgi:hypothetical protein